MWLSVIKMVSVCTQSAYYAVILLTTAITRVQLQDEYWNFGLWVPDSKTAFPPTLLFNRNRNPQRGNNHLKPNARHHAWVNFDLTETGRIRGLQRTDTWDKRSEEEMINDSHPITGKSRVLSNEKEGYSENNEHNARTNPFNNLTWPSEFVEGSVASYKNYSASGTPGQKLNESNRAKSPSDIVSRRVDNYQSDFGLGSSQHKVNDINFSMAHTSSDKHTRHTSHDGHHSVKTRNILWSTELGSVRAEHRNNPETRPAGHHLSNSNPSILPQEDDKLSTEGHEKSNCTANRLAKERIYRNINTGRQQNEDKQHDILQSFHVFETNRFHDFGTSKEKRSNNVWDGLDLGTNRFSDPTWYNHFGTERQQDNVVQDKLEARRRHSITPWHGDSDRRNYADGSAQNKYDSGENLFEYNSWHRQTGSNGEKDASKYQNSFDNRFSEDAWYSDTGTGSDAIQISGENQEDGDLQHSFYSARSPFGDVRWPSDSDTITKGGKQDGVDTQSTSDSRHDDYRGGTEKHDREQGKFDFHRNSFGAITWDNSYSSASGHRVPQFSQLHEFDPHNNSFGGTSWHNVYSLHAEKQYVPAHEEVGGERINNHYTDGAVSFHHAGHPQIATEPADAVTRYILPNGTRMMRVRRIVLYRKPEAPQPPQKESPKTFADIAKAIIQKKVAKCKYGTRGSINQIRATLN